MLKAMANLIRPAPDRRDPRHKKSPSPPPADLASKAHQLQQAPEPVRTRRLSKTLLKPPLDALAPAASPAKPVSRTSARKRSTEELNGDARPFKQRRIHEFLQPKSAVTKPIADIDVSHVAPVTSTPKAAPAPAPASLPASPATPAPEQTPTTTDKMVLREQRDTISKSEIAKIFDNYVFDIRSPEVPADAISDDEPILIIDNEKDMGTFQSSTSLSSSPNRTRKHHQPPQSTTQSTNAPAPTTSAPTFVALDYTSMAKLLGDLPADAADPLADSLYTDAHRKMEKQEASGTRNLIRKVIENEHLARRLIKGLEGDDWLAVMDIPSVRKTGSDVWLPKRRYYMRELKSYLESGRLYKEREKALKNKNAPPPPEDDDEEDTDDEEESKPQTTRRKPSSSTSRPRPPTSTTTSSSSSKPTPHTTSPPRPRRPLFTHGYLLPFDPAAHAKPFKSFYKTKNAKRDAFKALRAGKDADVFGVPLPEGLRARPKRRRRDGDGDDGERAFGLPAEWAVEEVERVNARARRRARRERREEGKV